MRVELFEYVAVYFWANTQNGTCIEGKAESVSRAWVSSETLSWAKSLCLLSDWCVVRGRLRRASELSTLMVFAFVSFDAL